MVMFLFILIIIFLIYQSLHWLWGRRLERNQSITFENFILLLMTYSIVLSGFGLIYFIFGMEGIPVLIEGTELIEGSFFQHLEATMYFSAVTLLSVGYGDITPIGIGRWIAIIEALFGYAMPAAFVVRTVIDIEKT